MSRVLHIIDADTPADMLDALAVLAGEEDVIISAGPPPQHARLSLPVKAVHRPMGSARFCGIRMMNWAEITHVIHAWSCDAAKAASYIGSDHGDRVVVSIPSASALHGLEWLAEEVHYDLEKLALTVPTEFSRVCAVRAGWAEPAVHVLPPPASPIDNAKERRRRTRERLGLTRAEVLMVAPAEMTRSAGHKYASWTHAIMIHLVPGVRLAMPGGGPNQEHVRFFAASTRFEKEVFLTGYRFDSRDILAAADLAVFFHERDCGVGALAAAMAAGLPIVASNTSETAQCVTNEQEALLVAPRDPRSQADAVLRLIDDPALARRLGAAASRRAKERFAPQSCRREIERIYSAAGRT